MCLLFLRFFQVFFLVWKSNFTACIRRMTGGYVFIRLSVNRGGVPPSFLIWGRGTPYFPMGGTPPPHHQNWMGYPPHHQDWMGIPPSVGTGWGYPIPNSSPPPPNDGHLGQVMLQAVCLLRFPAGGLSSSFFLPR